jgi:endoglucanase
MAMKRISKFIGLALAATALWCSEVSAKAPAWLDPGGGSRAYHRGMNVLGYDPIWKDPAQAHFETRHFAEIRSGGFDFIRVNLQIFSHLDGANRIDPTWLKRLDWVVREADRAGLGVILDEHDFDKCSVDVAGCRIKLSAVWAQLAPRYRWAPSSVAFELLNEPHEALNGAPWNALLIDLLKLVRRTNKTRAIVIGPSHWNSLADLPLLELPKGDRNILVTFHFYEPFRFTHQGASWTDMKELRGVTWGSAADRASLSADFDKVASWSKTNRRPILLGEFGAYDKSGTPEAMRLAYTSAVAREAERRGFSWAYWQFDGDFIAWDMKHNAWVEPIRHALIP